MLRDLFCLFPACAGVIPQVDDIAEVLQSFPRMCGGDPYLAFDKNTGLNFSPHVRG